MDPDTVYLDEGAAARCCDLHGQHCEPPSELCCHECTEAHHPAHPHGVRCVLDEGAERRHNWGNWQRSSGQMATPQGRTCQRVGCYWVHLYGTSEPYGCTGLTVD